MIDHICRWLMHKINIIVMEANIKKIKNKNVIQTNLCIIKLPSIYLHYAKPDRQNREYVKNSCSKKPVCILPKKRLFETFRKQLSR